VTVPAGRTVGHLLDEATRRLTAAHVPEARREAVALLALALATDRGGVIARRPDAVDDRAAARVDDLVAARERRVPLQHLTRTAEFRGLDFTVGPDVLIPRPETEQLVEAVLDLPLGETALVADLGTGSGCIAVALAVARPAWRILAVDRSERALAVAGGNAVRHRVAGRIELRARDFGELTEEGRAVFDAVVSNPPYVAEEEWPGLQLEVRDHEPRMALVAGPTGLEAYDAIARAARGLLAPGGWLALELGWKSERGVRGLLSRHGFAEIEVRPDVQGIPRVLTARLR
jgi:release factor glutamine methyltransferase